MKASKRKRLQAAGWKVGDARSFLGLTDEEVALIEMKLALAEQSTSAGADRPAMCPRLNWPISSARVSREWPRWKRRTPRSHWIFWSERSWPWARRPRD